MANLVVSDTSPRIQYVATSAQINFIVPFAFFANSDLKIYQTPAGQTPDAAADILSSSDYVVTGAGLSAGGSVALNTGAPINDIITIVRDMPIARTTDFNTGENFTAAGVDQQFDRVVMMVQQVESLIQKLGVTYSVVEALISGDNALPKLPIPASGKIPVWSINASGALIAAQLDENINASALRSELADQNSGSDGARIVGANTSVGGPATVHDKLEDLENIRGDLASQVNGVDGGSLVGVFATISGAGTVTEKINDLESSSLVGSGINTVIGSKFGENPWQRGTTANLTSAESGAFTADRFHYINTTSAEHTVSKSNQVPSIGNSVELSTHSAKIEVTTADASITASDEVSYNYIVEGYDWARLYQQPFKIYFWVRSSLIGRYYLSLRSDGKDSSYIVPYDIAVADTFQEIEIDVAAAPVTGTWDTASGAGLRVGFSLDIGSVFHTAIPNTWQIGNFMANSDQVNLSGTIGNDFHVENLRVGKQNADRIFSNRPIGETISLCQRYYQKSYSISVAPGTVTSRGAITSVPLNVGGVINDFSRSLRNSLRVDGVVNWYNPTTGSINNIRIGAANIAASATTSGTENTGNPGSTVPAGVNVASAQYTIDSEIS